MELAASLPVADLPATTARPATRGFSSEKVVIGLALCARTGLSSPADAPKPTGALAPAAALGMSAPAPWPPEPAVPAVAVPVMSPLVAPAALSLLAEVCA